MVKRGNELIYAGPFFHESEAVVENSQRAHSRLLVAGNASELKMSKSSLNLEDSRQFAAGFFNWLFSAFKYYFMVGPHFANNHLHPFSLGRCLQICPGAVSFSNMQKIKILWLP